MAQGLLMWEGNRPVQGHTSFGERGTGAGRAGDREMREKVPGFISIDTTKAAVALGALDAGASIINDVTGGRADPEMMMLAAEKKAAFIIMHMQGTPQTMQMNPSYNDVVTEVADFFRQQYTRALECGIDSMAIAFDPGIGFGKPLSTISNYLPTSRVSGFTIGRSWSVSRASLSSVRWLDQPG